MPFFLYKENAINPQQTFNPQNVPSGLGLQGSSPQLQSSPNMTFALQPAQGIPLYTGGGVPLTGTGGGGGSSGSPVKTPGGTSGVTAANPNTNPMIAQGIQQEYGTAINAGNALYGQNEANLPTNEGALNNSVNAQENAARQQTQGQIDVYNQQAAGVTGQRELSLSELLDQIRGQSQGLQAQLGAVGAGSSSAAGLGSIALQKEQNINAANINQQAGSNIANINAQIKASQSNLQPYLNTIEAYKQQQLNQIIQNYNQVKTNIQQALGSAQGEEKFRLGLYAQGLAQTAGDALTALNNQVNASKAQVAQQAQQNYLGPQFQALPTQAAPAAITSTNVNPFSINTPGGGTETNTPTGGSLSTLLKQNS